MRKRGDSFPATDDIEPANDGIGYGAVNAVRLLLDAFRRWSGSRGAACVHPE